MQKLLDQFKADQTDANRVKLQKYITKHPMAACLVSTEDFKFLKEHGFKL